MKPLLQDVCSSNEVDVTFAFPNLLRRIFFLLLICNAGHMVAQGDSALQLKLDGLPFDHLKIKGISYNGNKTTKPHILSRELTFTVGDSLEKGKLTKVMAHNVERILNLQLFSLVNYDITIASGNEVEVLFTVTELFYWIANPQFSLADRNFNVWWVEEKRDLNRINIGAILMRQNLRGRNEEMVIGVQLGYNKVFEFSYQIPFIDKKLHQGIGISALFTTGKEINYTTDRNRLLFYFDEQYPYQRFQTKLHYTYRNAYAAIHEIQLGFNQFNITEALRKRSPDFMNGALQTRYFELNYIYRYNNTDVRIYPLKGWEIKMIASKKGFGFKNEINRFDFNANLGWYKKLKPKWSFSSVFHGRLTFPQRQPYFINRGLGFKNEYVRGYEYYVIDGSHFALLRSNLRYKIIDRVFQQPYIKFMKFIPFRMYAKAYNDFGFVNNEYPGNSFLHNKILQGYGLGIDFVFSYYFTIRVEYSANHLGQNGLFLHGSKE